ncbi:hypothetical protein K438DRAFT_2031780 [Mycena galopus ATCC 62051]|nr:hypothetical protein K438DRAFT_2031780 [Mycena galopus ATCC 62051]
MPTPAPYPFLECVPALTLHPFLKICMVPPPLMCIPTPTAYPFFKYARACTHSIPLPQICSRPHLHRTPSSNMPAPVPYPFLKCVRPHLHYTPSLNMPAPALHPFLKYACTCTVPPPLMCMPAPTAYPFLKYARARTRTVPPFLKCVRPYLHCTPSLNTPAPTPYPSSNVYACARTVPLPRMCTPALALHPFLKYACTCMVPLL